MLEKNIAVQKDFERGREPRILYLDLEISPLLMWSYSAYEGNALQIKLQPHIVSFAWQWEGEKKIHVRTLPDYKGYKASISKLDDKALCTELHEVMEQADVIVGHNVKRFDIKHAKARFIYHNLPVSKRWVVEDTLTIAKKYFRFPKNNLDELGRHFGIGDKTKVKHSDVIFDCLDGDMKAWKAMAVYNIQDIKLTRDVYKKLSGWHETHYNLNLIRRSGKQQCPVCASTRFEKRGLKYLATTIKQRYHCLERDCGRYWVGEIVAKAPKKEEVTTFTERVEQSN